MDASLTPRVEDLATERAHLIAYGEPIPSNVQVESQPLVRRISDRLRGVRAEDLDRPAHVTPQIPAEDVVHTSEGSEKQKGSRGTKHQLVVFSVSDTYRVRTLWAHLRNAGPHPIPRSTPGRLIFRPDEHYGNLDVPFGEDRNVGRRRRGGAERACCVDVR